MILFRVVADIFRRHDTSGWGKAAWLVFVIVLPFLGVLIYLIANAENIATRDVEQSRAARAELDDYVKSVAAPGGAAAEIDKGKQLLDSGAILKPSSTPSRPRRSLRGDDALRTSKEAA